MTAQRKWVADPFAMFKVMAKVLPFNQDEIAELATPAQLAFEKIRNGHGTGEDFEMLATAVNVTLVAAEDIDPLVERTAQLGIDAMNSAKSRFDRIGRYGFSGLETQHMLDCMDLHNQLLGLLTPLQVSNAAKEVRARSIQQQKETS